MPVNTCMYKSITHIRTDCIQRICAGTGREGARGELGSEPRASHGLSCPIYCTAAHSSPSFKK